VAAPRFPASPRARAAVAVAFGIALALRIWNADTGLPNPDEEHYASDGLWAHVDSPGWSAVEFLREHAAVHRRIDPETYEVGVWPPPTSRQSFLPHPAFQAWLLGPVLAAYEKPSIGTAVSWLRGFDLAADAAVVLLLVPFVLALGGSEAAAIAAAALYAVYPPAVVYGSLVNQDVFLAPLLLLTLLAVLRAGAAPRSWIAAGLWTGLAIASKASGILLLPVVTAIAVARRPEGWLRGLVVFGAVAAAVASVFVDPFAFAHLFLDPSIKMASVAFDPWTRLVGNLSFMADVPGYYLLSFWQHGEPWAPALARVHPLVTPVFQVLAIAGLASLVVAAEYRVLLPLLLPIFLLLGWLNPTDGMWRVHLVGPLLVATIALGWSRMTRPWRAAALVVGLLLAVRPLLPLRPDAHYNVDLGNVLFASPGHHQASTVYRALKGSPVLVELARAESVSRTLWLGPGDYDVIVVAASPVVAALGSTSWQVLGDGPIRVHLTDRFPLLSLTALDSPASIRRVTLLPVAGS
jgi:hypothetical protein